ncbi:MAG: hypothetical protein ACYC6G_16105 [Desulfobaccales bacterium]
MSSAELHPSQPAHDARSCEQGLTQADSIISFAIAYAMREYPELVQTDLIRLIRRDVELTEENEELRRRLTRLLRNGVTLKDDNQEPV